MKRTLPALIIALTASLPALAGMDHGSGMTMANVSPVAASADHHPVLATGLVRKINKAQGKLTIRHGPLENLDMPAMTMAFRVTDPGVLDRLKPGDRIRFHAGMTDGQLVASRIETVH
ncbi:MAG: copper-binding protein [Gallionellaceae bacterium]|nr:copper-binding protein [Gallionellaceae bacterium]